MHCTFRCKTSHDWVVCGYPRFTVLGVVSNHAASENSMCSLCLWYANLIGIVLRHLCSTLLSLAMSAGWFNEGTNNLYASNPQLQALLGPHVLVPSAFRATPSNCRCSLLSVMAVA